MFYLQYNQELLPITIDFAVVKTVCAKHSIKLSEIEKAVENPDMSLSVVFEGLRRGHALEKKDFKFIENEVEEILSHESNYADFLMIFSECVLKMFTPTKKK